MTLFDRVSSKNKNIKTQRSLVDQAASSVKWSILYNIVPRFVTPFSTMILAALLTPADFGLVAVATFINALAKILVDMGLGKAVIQRQTNVEEAASISFWLSLLSSITLYGFLWVAAPWISVAYKNEKLIDVIRVAAIFLPLGGLAVIPKAVLRRNMEFQQLFWVNSLFLIIQAIASVILALRGLGYWALIYGELIGMVISTLLAWIMAGWIPKIVMSLSIVRSMLSFSAWIMLSALQNWMFLYAGNAIGGFFLGVQGLGVYALGLNIATIVPAFLTASFGDVAYPTFCKLQDTPNEVGRSLLSLQMLIGAILFPFAFGLAAIAPSAIELLYGNKWEHLGSVIGLLVLMPGLGFIWSLNEHAYQAVGRPVTWIKLSTAALFILLPILWIAAPHGLLAFSAVRFIGGLVLPVGNIILGARTLGVGLREQIRTLSTPFVAALITFLTSTLLIRLWAPFEGALGWIRLFVIVMIGAMVYLFLLWRGNRDLWNKLLVSTRMVLARS